MTDKSESTTSEQTVQDLLQSAQESFERGAVQDCDDSVRRAVDLLKSQQLKNGAEQSALSSEAEEDQKQYFADVFDCTQIILVLLQHKEESHPSHRENLRLLACLCEITGRLDESSAIYARANQLSRKFGKSKRVTPEADEGSIADQIITLCDIPALDKMSSLTQSDDSGLQAEAEKEAAPPEPAEATSETPEDVPIEAIAAGALDAILKDKLLIAPAGGKGASAGTKIFEQESLLLMTAAISSFQSGDFDESVRCYKLILRQYDMLGLRLSDTALDCRLSLGAAYSALGDLPNALSEYSHLAILLEEKLGTAHPYYIAHLHRLTRTCQKAGKLKEARAIINRAAVLVERHLYEEDELRAAVINAQQELLQNGEDTAESPIKTLGNEIASVVEEQAHDVREPLSESVQDILQSAETAFENGEIAASNEFIQRAYEMLKIEAAIVAAGVKATDAEPEGGMSEKRRKQYRQDVFDCTQILLVLLQHEDEAEADYQTGVRMLAGLNEQSGKLEESKALHVHANQLSRRFGTGSTAAQIEGSKDAGSTFSDLPATDFASSLTQVNVEELFAASDIGASLDALDALDAQNAHARTLEFDASPPSDSSIAEADEQLQLSPKLDSPHFQRLLSTRRAKQTLDTEGGIVPIGPTVTDPGTRLLIDAANSAFQSGEFEEAVRCYKLILPQFDAQGLRDSDAAVDCRLSLGAAHVALADLAGALSEYSLLALILEKKLGIGHPFYISNLHRLARTCERAGKLTEAKGIIKRASALAERYLSQQDELRLCIADCENQINRRLQEICEMLQIPATGERSSSSGNAGLSKLTEAGGQGELNTTSNRMVGGADELTPSANQMGGAEPGASTVDLRDAANATGDRQQMSSLSINDLVIWIASCVLAVVAVAFWWPMLVQDTGSTSVTRSSSGSVSSQVFKSADLRDSIEFGPGSAIISVNDQPRTVPYIELNNDFTSIFQMIANLQVNKIFWVEKTPSGLRTDSGEVFFGKDAAESKLIGEMQRIMESVQAEYNQHQTYPTSEEDWQAKRWAYFIDPIDGKPEMAVMKAYNRFTQIEDIFEGSTDVTSIVSFLKHGGRWFNEEPLRPLMISCGTLCSNERRNGHFASDHFFMHATDREGRLLAGRHGDVLVGFLYKNIDNGNLLKEPARSSAIPPGTAWPLPRTIMFVTNGPALWLGFVPLKYALVTVVVALFLIFAFMWLRFDFSKRVNNPKSSMTLLEGICILLMVLVSMCVIRSLITGG